MAAMLFADLGANVIRLDRLSKSGPGIDMPTRFQLLSRARPSVAVDLKPIDSWTAGLGLAVERPLPGGWSAGLEAGHRWFELDSAHRNGSTIETRRERFGDWTARASLARRWGRS